MRHYQFREKIVGETTVPETQHRFDIPDGYQVRLFTGFDEPALGQDNWNELASRSDTNTIFQTYEWVTSWWKVFGQGRELWVIAVFRGDRLVGLAPLMRELSDGTAPVIAFISENNADYCDFLLTEPRRPVLQAILATLASQRDQWRELRFMNLPERSFTTTWIREICKEMRLLTLSSGRIECPAMVFGERSSAEQAILHRRSLKRPWNYFRHQGLVELTEPRAPAEVHGYLEQFFDQHITRWRHSSTPSLFTNPHNQNFYHELATRLLSSGKLAFACMTLDGRPLAFHFGFIYDRRYFWYKPSFDIRYQHHSPGTLMLRLLLLRALKLGCDEFDFTIGNEPFKYRYSNVTRHNQCLHVFPQCPAYLLRRLGLIIRIWLKRLLRHV